MWEVHIQHEGLRARRVLKGPTQADAQWKATGQLLRWEARWNAQQKANLFCLERQSRQMLTLHGRAIAAALTAESAQRVAALGSILKTSLHTGLFLHWELLKDRSVFEPPVLPEPRRTPPPQLLKAFYAAQLTLLDDLLPWRRKRKELEAADRFDRDLLAWQAACRQMNQRADLDFKCHTEERERNRLRHHTAQLEQHARVDETKAAFEHRDKDAVEFFFSELLSRSAYPHEFPEEAALHYHRSTATLTVDYELPSIAAWPAAMQFNYLPGRNKLREIPLSAAWLKQAYEDALYQIALRALDELFTHDYAHTLDTVAFNGWVRSLDKASGNIVHARILSVQVTRTAFTAINLAHVDPLACFRRLKGSLSSDPVALVPVHAALLLPRDDNRLITPRVAVAFEEEEVEPSVASMKRSDFEHLIREAFEREFRKNRAQLTVAQADHGIPLDA